MKAQREHKDNDNRGTDLAERWSDCVQGNPSAGGGGTAWPETQTLLWEKKSNCGCKKKTNCFYNHNIPHSWHTTALNRHMRFTSDLRAACETDRYRWSRGVGGGMLGLSHPVGLMDTLAPAELSVLCWARAEPRCLIVTCLTEDREGVLTVIHSFTFLR